MSSRWLASAALAAILAAAQAPDLKQRAREAAGLLLQGRFEALAEWFAPQMKQAAPPEKLAQAVGPVLKALGEIRRIGEPQTGTLAGMDAALVPVECERGSIQVQVTFDASGAIAGLFLRPPGFALTPAWQRPSYSRPESFEEREIVAGAAGWPLPATLTMPRGEGPWPAVVLVHGSGPNDRDETVMAAKPFRDLAEGLASCGVAVLRYEKRTRTHAQKLARRDITLDEEVLDDALAAVALLRNTPGIDGKRVYVLGHSLGAWLAPLIAAADGRLAGLILMAAPARPIEQLYVEQIRYLASLHGEPSAAEKEKIAEAEREAAAVRQIRERGEGPERALGAPRSYWLSFRGRDPLAVAPRISTPLLVLQGGRDYQVTEKDFNLWKGALEGKAGVTLKMYPRLNHIFVEGGGRSTPQEYTRPGVVSDEVAADIASWILRQQPRRR
jgi:dienelactone hydrolase